MVPRLQRLAGKDLQEARARYGAALARLPKQPVQPAPEVSAKVLASTMQDMAPAEPREPTPAEFKEFHDSMEPEAIARRNARPDPFLEVLQAASKTPADQQGAFRAAVPDPEIPA